MYYTVVYILKNRSSLLLAPAGRAATRGAVVGRSGSGNKFNFLEKYCDADRDSYKQRKEINIFLTFSITI